MERKFAMSNVVIMRKKEFFDIFYIHKFRKYYKNYDLDKTNFIPLELYDEGGSVNNNFVKTNILCNKKNCKIPYGECLNNKICECLEGYASIENNIFNNSTKQLSERIYCSYKQKYQLYAFLFEFIFFFGIGHFYLRRIYQGIIKLVLFIILSFLFFLIKKFDIKSKFFLDENISNMRNFTINISMILSFCAFLTLHIFDIYMLVTNSYLDGYGIEVLSWNRDLGKIISFDFLRKNI